MSALVQISPLRPAAETDMAKVRTGENAYYWWVFPNLLANLYSGVMDVNIVPPLGPERCKVIFDWFFPRDAAEQFSRDSILLVASWFRRCPKEIQRVLAREMVLAGLNEV